MTSRILIGAFGLLAIAMAGAPALAESSHHRTTEELAAQSSRTRITIYPRRRELGPNAKRECRARLVQEYRPSGTVIVPRMQCWWE
jgi:hypothetical protein